MDDQETIRGKLNELKTEHRDLDQAIAALSAASGGAEALSLQRLKKRKLQLKDQIARLESKLLPDIIA
jgi:hypothetical protein